MLPIESLWRLSAILKNRKSINLTDSGPLPVRECRLDGTVSPGAGNVPGDVILGGEIRSWRREGSTLSKE